MNMKYILSKFKTNSKLDVKEATDILMQFGISHNEEKTRDLIAKGKLAATAKGNNPRDRPSGYVITEKAIYDLVITEIPIMKDIFEHINSENTKKNSEKKPKQTAESDVKNP